VIRRTPYLVASILVGLTAYFLVGNWRATDTEPITLNKHDFARVGDFRPDFRHERVNGELDDIKNYTGTVVLLNFWATWCLPCREEMPMLQELQQEFGSEGFQVIGIALDEAERVGEFLAEHGITYPNMVGSGDVILTGLNYGNSSGTLPYSVLIDREGIIRWREHGEIKRRLFSKRLKQLL
jgi:peroxiredoxin